MSWLILSLAALGAGPLAASRLRRSSAALFLLDGFVAAGILGICLGHLLPDALARAGWPVIAAALLGFLVPAWSERGLQFAHHRLHRLVLLLAVAGLVVHAGMDGAALGMPGGGEGPDRSLGLAVVLHRIPVGLLLWTTLRPLFGSRGAWGGIFAVACGTLIGFGISSSLEGGVSWSLLPYLLALVAGGLTHVILHETRMSGTERGRPHWGAAGAVAAAALLMPWSGTARNLPGEGGFLFLFVALFWIPTLAGSLLSALLAPGARHRTASRPGFAILSGLRLAFETPVCSCGALPVYEDLAGHGGSLRRGLSFLLAAPVLQLENLILAAVLLGPRFALLWLLADLLVAGGLAVFLSRKGTLLAGAARLDGFDSGHAPSEAGPRAGFLRARFAGFSDRIQHATAWLLAGLVLLLLASAAGLAPVSTAPGESPLLLVLLVSLLALPWTLDPKALLPLAWFLSGAPAGAILALLLIGPLTGRAARRTLARLHGARFSATLTALLFVTAAGLGWLLDPILALPKSPPAAEFLAFLEPLRSQTLFLSLFLLPALYALFRCGPRGLLAQVLPAREHEHAHHPGEPHEHTGAQRVQIDLAGEPPSSTREP